MMDDYTILYGIVAESQMTTQISPEIIPQVLRALNVRLPQLAHYENPLRESLAKLVHQPSIAIQKVFRALRDPYFISKVSGIANGFGSSDNIRMVKISLYLFGKGSLRCLPLSLVDISQGVRTVSLYQRKNVCDGVPTSLPVIKSLLKDMNKYIPNQILKLWLDKSGAYLRFSAVITPYEFLFLLANCKNRLDAIRSLPYHQISVVPEASGTFPIDDIVHFPGHPDALLESMSGKYLALDRVVFTGNTEPRVEVRNQSIHSNVEAEVEAGSRIEDLRRELNRTEQKEEIRKVIEECKQKLNAAKLGGRLTFEEKYNHIQIDQTQSSKSFQKQAKLTQSFANLGSIPQSRKSFFESTHYSTYVPAHILFPAYPKFRKVIRRRPPQSSSSKSRPVTSTKPRFDSKSWIDSKTYLETKSDLTFTEDLKLFDTLDMTQTSGKSVVKTAGEKLKQRPRSHVRIRNKSGGRV